MDSSLLQRWVEELCRIKYQRLESLTVKSGIRIRSGRLPDQGGIYAFWWLGGADMLKDNFCRRQLGLIGPGGNIIELSFSDEWLGLSANLPVPLYVGKSHGSINKRVGLHLQLSKTKILPETTGNCKAKAPTTTCQLRAGIEHLFPEALDSRSIVLKHVGLSYVILHGEEHAANRFYLEDLAIGQMRPPLNVDVER